MKTNYLYNHYDDDPAITAKKYPKAGPHIKEFCDAGKILDIRKNIQKAIKNRLSEDANGKSKDGYFDKRLYSLVIIENWNESGEKACEVILEDTLPNFGDSYYSSPKEVAEERKEMIQTEIPYYYLYRREIKKFISIKSTDTTDDILFKYMKAITKGRWGNSYSQNEIDIYRTALQKWKKGTITINNRKMSWKAVAKQFIGNSHKPNGVKFLQSLIKDNPTYKRSQLQRLFIQYDMSCFTEADLLDIVTGIGTQSEFDSFLNSVKGLTRKK